MTSSRPAVTRFDHITIVASALDGARDHYATLLGVEPVWQGSHPELGTESALFGVQNAMVEISAPRANAEESEGLRYWLTVAGEGLQAIAFGTDDAAACSKALREQGLRATPPQPGAATDQAGRTRDYQTVELSPRNTRNVPVLVVERPDFDALAISVLAPAPDCVHALDHVVIRTANIDAAKALYGAGLGVRLALERDFGGTRMLFFRVGGVTLEVVEDLGLGESDRLWGAAYRVRDLPAAHARIAGAGIEVSEIRVGHKAGTQVFTVRGNTHGVATLFLHDPART